MTAGRLDPPVTLVLEGQGRAGADEADVDGVEVVHAAGEGDDTIAAIAEAHCDVTVVTADRETPTGSERPTPRSSGRAGCSTSSWTDLQAERGPRPDSAGQRVVTSDPDDLCLLDPSLDVFTI